MPRFPVLSQRTSAPAAFSNTPRAQAAHFSAGIGRNLARLGSEAAEFGQVIEQRRERQVKQQMSQFDLELAKQRAESDAQAPPEEASDARIERYQSIFDASSEKLLQGYEGQGLQRWLREDIELRRGAWNEKLLADEAQQRLGKSLQDARGLVEHWAGRVAADAKEFSTASRELLGDEARGEPGLLAGLSLRPEALSAWRGHVLNQLLDAQMQSDPAGLLADLESERWQEMLPEGRRDQLLDDAQDAHRRAISQGQAELTRFGAQTALELSQNMARGTAGLSDIRRAEETGVLSASQAEALRGEAEQAEIAQQAREMASEEFTVSLSSGIGFDLENPQHRQAADRFYETTYSQTVRADAPEETLFQVVSAVAKTGYLPPRLARDTTGLLLGSDESRQIKGAELYTQLREAAPELVEESINLEAQAWGGVLKRWLDAGLEPADASRRAEADFPRDGGFLLFDEDETAVLKRDLGSLFFGENSAHRVRQILDRLERNSLEDLAQGLTPREARARARRDLGQVMHKLSRFKTVLESHLEIFAQRDEGGHPLFQPVNAVVLPGPVPLPVPVPQADDHLSAAAALELEGGLRKWAQRKNDEDFNDYLENMEALIRLFPAWTASLFGFAMLSVGDGKNFLGKILQEDERTGVRSVVIDHPTHGRMTIRQRYDISAETHWNLDVILWDPKKREYVTEKLPSSRFYVPQGFAGEVANSDSVSSGGGQAMEIPLEGSIPNLLPGPSSEPDPRFGTLPPAQDSGRGRVPLHTGGNQTDLGPLTELTPGFPAEEQKPQIYVNPDQSDEIRGPTILLNEEGTPIYDGIPISERFIHKAGKKHHTEDVWFDEKGYPIFDKYVIETVEIELTGSRRRDRRIASKKALEKGKLTSIPKDYVWHHHQDMKTMQLLPDWLHRKVGHTGGGKNSGKGYK